MVFPIANLHQLHSQTSIMNFTSHSTYSKFLNQPLSTQTFHKDKRGQGKSFEKGNNEILKQEDKRKGSQ